MTFFEQLFDRILFINLDDRPDRLAQAHEEFRRLGIKKYDRIPGFRANQCGYDAPNGHLGCTSAHRCVLDVICYTGWKRTLVFEDDFMARSDDVDAQFKSLYSYVPDNWDLLYLAGHYGAPPTERINEHVIRPARMLTTSSYAVTQNMARKMAPYISGPVGIDDLYSGFQPTSNIYILQPRLFVQRTGHSDIAGHDANWEPCMTDVRHEQMV